MVTSHREVHVQDELNVPRLLWGKLLQLEVIDTTNKEIYNKEFKLFYILEALNYLFEQDNSIKTAGSTTELFLNSALGKILISLLHRYDDAGITFQVSSLLLKYLKSISSKGASRLTAEQAFLMNYTVLLIKHYQQCIDHTPRDQKKLSAEIIYYLVKDNPICLNVITRLVPKHILRKVSSALNDRDITKWKAQEWFNTVEMLNLEFDKVDQENECLSRHLLDKISDYIADFYSNWKRVETEVVVRVYDNVVNHRASSLRDIVKIVQLRHNFEEFEIDYPRHLKKFLVGKYFLDDLYNVYDTNPKLNTTITTPEQFYQELKNFYINQKEIAAKVETLKVLTLLYSTYPLHKIELMPYFINEYHQIDDPVFHYYMLQYFCSLVTCQEIYTRYHNMNEFFKHNGLSIVTKTILKSLVEQPNDNVELPIPYQNFSKVPIPRLAFNKSTLKANTILVGLFLMTNVKFFDRSQTGTTIDNLKKVPERRSTKHFMEADTINLVMQLLLHKDDVIVKTVLNFLAVAFKKNAMIAKVAETNTFWERIIQAGLRGGVAPAACTVLCTFASNMMEDPVTFDKELKDLRRLFPDYIIECFAHLPPAQCNFVLDFENRIDAQVYWTRPMYEELARTIGYLFPLDIQALEDYYSGKKKPFPKARTPTLKVVVHYDIPKELISVEGLFLNSLINKQQGYNFMDDKLIKDTLYTKCVDLFEKRLNSKEFQNFDPIYYSDLRIIARTCLMFAKARRLKNELEFAALIEAAEVMSEEWVKHSTRLTARGPLMAFCFTQTMIDLVKFGTILLDIVTPSPERILTLCQVANTLSGKLLKKLSIDKSKITYIEFKLLKSILKLQSKLLGTKREEVQKYYSNIINSLEQENDFLWIHCLRFIQDHVEILKLEGLPQVESKEAAQDAKKRLEAGPSGQPTSTTTPNPVASSTSLYDFSEDVKSVASIPDTQELPILVMRLDKAFLMESIVNEGKKKIVKFISHIFDVLKRLTDLPLCIPGLVRDGVLYAIMELIIKIYVSNPTDAKLKRLAQSFTTIFRKVLASSCEATIRHFGEEHSAIEISLRGHNHELLAKLYEPQSQEYLLPLVEFFRVFRKNFMMKFITQAIGDYGAFQNESFQHNASKAFLDWFFEQKEVKEPEFVWSLDYAKELEALLTKQIDSIIYSKKANYSYYLDDFQSAFLKKFTRVGDIFLEPLIATEGYQIKEPERLLKKLGIECDAWATNTLNKGGSHNDDHLKVLLRSLLVVTKSTDNKVFCPTLTHFLLQLLKIEKNMSDETRKLMMRVMLVLGQSDSTSIVLIRSNLFQRFIILNFDKDQETTAFKMRILLLFFGHRSTSVLFAERGFDVCILKSVLAGQCKNEEIQALTNELLDKLPSDPKLQMYFNFVKNSTKSDDRQMKFMFDHEVFFPTLIILAETKVTLMREINEAIADHEKKLASTEEEVIFDYSKLSLELPENKTFFKLGDYYIEVLLLRPEYLKTVNIQLLNAQMLEYLAANGGLTQDVDNKRKLLSLLLLEMQAGIADPQSLSVLFGFILNYLSEDKFSDLSYDMKVLTVEIYIYLNRLHNFHSDNEAALFSFFRKQFEGSFTKNNPQDNLLASLLLKPFMIKAAESTESVQPVFGDFTEFILANRESNPVLSPEIERLISTVCQKGIIDLASIDHIKRTYNERYFSLMGIGFTDYIRDTFPTEVSFETLDKQLVNWMKPQNLQEKILKVPLYPDFSNDKVVSRYGDQIRLQK